MGAKSKELEKLEKELTKCESQIKDNMEKKDRLIRSIESLKMGMIYQAMLKSGKSVSEVISWLEQDTQSDKKNTKSDTQDTEPDAQDTKPDTKDTKSDTKNTKSNT